MLLFSAAGLSKFFYEMFSCQRQGFESDPYRRQFFFVALLLFSKSSFAFQTAEFRQERELQLALKFGDLEKVTKALDDTTLKVETKRFLQSLVSGDGDIIDQAAVKCRDAAYLRRDLSVLKRCAQTAYGVNFKRGDFSQWAAGLLWVQTRFPSANFGSGSNTVDLKAISKSRPLQITKAEEPVHRLIQKGAKVGVPIVEIKINGKKVRAILDTGMPQFLILDEDIAASLNMMPISGRLSVVKSSVDAVFLGDNRLAISDEVFFGGVSARNVGTVLAELPRAIGADAILGLPALQQFSGLEFDDATVVFHSRNSMICANGQQLLYSTDFDGATRMLAKIEINHSSRVALVDSGLNAPLAIYGRDASENFSGVGVRSSAKLTTVTRERSLSTESAILPLRLGTWKGTVSANIAPGVTAFDEILLGGRGFPGARLEINFTSNRICLSH